MYRGGLSLSIIIWRIGGGGKFPFALGPKNSLGGPVDWSPISIQQSDDNHIVRIW